MTARPLTRADWPDAEALYCELTAGDAVGTSADFEALLSHPRTSVFGNEKDGRVISMVTLHVLPNLTRGGRPYALIENVVTAKSHQGCGHGRAAIEAAVDSAKSADCYKVMLLTGQTGTAKGFYEAVGFSGDDKWGMIIRM